MCTVTYLPLLEEGFIITSNRDENRSRAASMPAALDSESSKLVFPKDPKSGGSWICASKSGTVVCLLNGAYKKHKHRPPYRKSRGLVVLDVFSFTSVDEFLEEYSFSEIEPFTLILRDKSSLTELRWDGSESFINNLDVYKTHLWASSTLYPDAVIEKRKYWFNQWLQEQDQYKMEKIVHWHKSTGEGDTENDLVMNRNNIVETISITSVARQVDEVTMSYLDLLTEEHSEFSFETE